jgi:hypothetical protein
MMEGSRSAIVGVASGRSLVGPLGQTRRSATVNGFVIGYRYGCLCDRELRSEAPYTLAIAFSRSQGTTAGSSGPVCC